jgi:hypothetical protein
VGIINDGFFIFLSFSRLGKKRVLNKVYLRLNKAYERNFYDSNFLLFFNIIWIKSGIFIFTSASKKLINKK